MRRRGLAVVAWLLWVSVGLVFGQTPPSPDPGAVELAAGRARQVASSFTQELLATLLAELKAGGPLQALTVCSVRAPELARAHSGEGIRVRRVTLKPRNPQSAPDAFERAHLLAMAERHEKGEGAGEVIETVQDGDRTVLRYLRPIVVGEMCVQCHGPRETLDPKVREFLETRYPQDQAVGYKAGDFRGAVSVSVVVEQGPGKR